MGPARLCRSKLWLPGQQSRLQKRRFGVAQGLPDFSQRRRRGRARDRADTGHGEDPDWMGRRFNQRRARRADPGREESTIITGTRAQGYSGAAD